jgi:hypothetical protein
VKKFVSIGGKNITDKQPNGNIFNSPFSSTVFDLGTFKVTTNISRDFNDSRYKLSISNDNNNFVSLSDLNIQDISKVKNINIFNQKIIINNDKTKLSNYSYFSSLHESFRTAINNCIIKFPGSLYVNNIFEDVVINNIFDIEYDSNKNITSFRIPSYYITNNFDVNLYTNISNISDDRDITVNFKNYEILLNNKTYQVNSFTGISNNNQGGYVKLSIDGNIFNSPNYKTTSLSFHIKLIDSKFYEIYNRVFSSLEKNLLSLDTSPKFLSTFEVPIFNIDIQDYDFILKDFIWSTSDGYNIDVSGVKFKDYTNNLLEIGKLYDDLKSNIILRLLVPENILVFDTTENSVIKKLLNTYGKLVDDVKIFIDSLSYIRNVSYDKIDNIPDLLVKNLATELGWEYQSILDDDTIMNNLFDFDLNDKTQKTTNEINIEFWRRLIINTNWFLKYKGTSNVIKGLFNFIGAPEALLQLNEYVYLTDKLVNINDLTDQQIAPFGDSIIDDENYPLFPTDTQDFYFQQYDYINNELYYENHKNIGFKINKTVDNKKSWVYNLSSVTFSSLTLNTSYNKESRAVINTKEVDMFYNVSNLIENDVYKSYSTGITFIDYIKNTLNKNISVKNRKVIYSETGEHYPTLYKIYEDYLNDDNTNKYNYENILSFINKINVKWENLITKFVSPTTIFNKGTIIKNTIFTQQKFQYKHGIDDGSEFLNNQPIETSDSINLVTIESLFNKEVIQEIPLLSFEGNSFDKDTPSLDTDSFNKSDFILKNKPKDIDFLETSFNKYIFSATGITKSAVTNTNYILNLSVNASPLIYFNFTGNNYTNSKLDLLYYKLNNRDNTFNTTPSIINNLNITADTSFNISNTYELKDNEYLIKERYTYFINQPSSNTITRVKPYNIYENFYENIYFNNDNYKKKTLFYDKNAQFTGSNITNNISTPIIYDNNLDYYLITTVNPSKPVLDFDNQTQAVNSNSTLFNEVIPINSNTSSFTLTFIPVGDIIVNINGLTYAKDFEYVKDTSIANVEYQNTNYKILFKTLIPNQDVLNISYLTNGNTNNFVTENIFYTGVSSNIIYNNTLQKYVLLLNNTIFGNDNVIISYNGLTLSNNADYSLSSNSILLEFSPTLNSNFSITYRIFTTNDNFTEVTIPSNPFNFSFNINETYSNKYIVNYTHEFFNKNNTTLTGNTLYSLRNTIPVNNINNFSDSINFSGTPITLGEKYLYRVKIEKNYLSSFNTTATTYSYSNTFLIKTPFI